LSLHFTGRKNVYYRNRNALGNIYATNCIVILENEKNLGVISWKCVYLCNQLKIKDEVIGSYPEKNQRGPGPWPPGPEERNLLKYNLNFSGVYLMYAKSGREARALAPVPGPLKAERKPGPLKAWPWPPGSRA